MPSRTPRRARSALSLYSDLMLAPMVVWMRLPLIAAEAGRDGGGAETARAVAEKAAALADGLVAAQLSWWLSATRFWPEFQAGRTPSILSGIAAEQAMRAALAPAGQRVRSNFRRLSRRRA